MLKISEAVFQILSSSDLALEAMRSGLLNLSAYAKQIHLEVEEKTWKSVKKSTIVVALSRISHNISEVEPLRPQIILDELSLKSPLCDVTYERTRQNVEALRTLSTQLSQAHFLTFTEGITEITVVASVDQLPNILKQFSSSPKSIYQDLVGVSVSFSEEYIPQPNVIYAILATLAGRRVNLMEIISTYTELTIIIEKKDLETCVQALNQHFRK